VVRDDVDRRTLEAERGRVACSTTPAVGSEGTPTYYKWECAREEECEKKTASAFLLRQQKKSAQHGGGRTRTPAADQNTDRTPKRTRRP